MIQHYHKDEGEKTVYHDGSLADCPDTEWDAVVTMDGKPARMARGMSVSIHPERKVRRDSFATLTTIQQIYYSAEDIRRWKAKAMRDYFGR